MSYNTEFPDFTMPDVTIPPGFEDISWHNDAMPSWFDEKHRIKIWIDYEDQDDSEFSDIPSAAWRRYTAHLTDEDGCWDWAISDDSSFSSNHWFEIIAHVNKLRG